MASGGGANGFADAFEDDGGEDGGVEGADAVDDALAVPDGFEDAWVGWWVDLLAVGIDVPYPLDTGGQVFFNRFGEFDVVFS